MLKFYYIFALSQWNTMISVAYNMYCNLLFRTSFMKQTPIPVFPSCKVLRLIQIDRIKSSNQSQTLLLSLILSCIWYHSFDIFESIAIVLRRVIISSFWWYYNQQLQNPTLENIEKVTPNFRPQSLKTHEN